jgi:co-chaperonin GroES (HSP10)
MSYEAMYEQVLLKRLDVDDSVSEGGIIKPDFFQMKSNRGEIVSVGADVPLLKKGDVVLFSNSGADEIDLDGEKFILVHRKQIYLRQKFAVLSKVV